MPTYSFLCESCNHKFDRFLTISERKKPEEESCPHCNINKIISVPALIGIFSDTTMTPDKKTKGDWGKLMTKMKRGLPQRVHKNLDKASSRTGRRFKG